MRLPLTALSLFAAPLAAQAGTDIFLVPRDATTGAVIIGNVRNITNRPGYDNQPSFSPDGKSIYFTSDRGGQTDIYRFDIETAATIQVTSTPENEYSATVMPGGKRFSVIRDSTQHLWSFALDGSAPALVLDSLKPIGYHAWLDASTVFVFVLGGGGQPATLRQVNVTTGAAKVVAQNIGRTIAAVPGRRMMSYAKRDSTGWWVHVIDGATGADTALAQLPGTNEYFAWTPHGELLNGSGNKLLQWNPGTARWTQVDEFSEPGLQRITRVAVSPTGRWIAVVGDEPRTQ